MRRKCAICEKFISKSHWFFCDNCYEKHDALHMIRYLLRDILESDLTPSCMLLAVGLALFAILSARTEFWYAAFAFATLGIASYALNHSTGSI